MELCEYCNFGAGEHIVNGRLCCWNCLAPTRRGRALVEPTKPQERGPKRGPRRGRTAKAATA